MAVRTRAASWWAVAAIAVAGSVVLGISSASAQSAYTWANSNVNGTPPANLDWFTGGPNTQGTWTGGTPVSSNQNTIQFFADNSTQLPNTAAPSTQAVNLNNSGTAFQLRTLTLTGRGSATTNASLTMNLSGDALNFSAATGTINLSAINSTRTVTYNVANNIQIGTASSASNLTLTGNGDNPSGFNFSGSVSELQAGGGSKLVKNGSSFATISGAVTVSGGVEVNAGNLLLSSSSNAITGGFTLNGGSLRYINPATVNGSNIIVNGTASFLQHTGSGVTNATITLNPGSNLSVGSDNATQTITGAITGAGALTIDRAAGGSTSNLNSTANTFTGNISFVSGATFSASFNSFADATSLGAAKIRFASVNSVQTFALGSGAIAAHTLNNRQIEIAAGSGANAVINNNSSQAFTINTDLLVSAASGSRTLVLGGAGAGLSSFNGIIGNGAMSSLSLTKADSGTWVLGGSANTYTGATQVQGGTLVVNKLANFSASSSIGAASSGAIILGSGASLGTLVYTGAAAESNRTIQVNSTVSTDTGGAAILNYGSGALTFNAATFNVAYTNGSNSTRVLTLGGTNGGQISGTIQNNSANSLVGIAKAGSGRWALQGDNTNTGASSMSGGGNLVLDYSTNTGSKLSDTASLTLSGGTITLKGGTGLTETVGSTALSSGATFITRDGGNTSLQLNALTQGAGGNISFVDGTVAKTTTTTTAFGIFGGWATIGNDFAANDGSGNIVAYSGPTTALPTSGAGSNSTHYTLSGSQAQAGTTTLAIATLKITGTGETDNTLALAATGLSIRNNADTTEGGILYTGGGTGVYNITADAGKGLAVTNTGRDLTINTVTGTLQVSAAVGVSTNSTSVLKAGAGTLVLSAANPYTQTTFVNEGTLRLANNTAAGTTAAGTQVQAGAALELSNNITVGAEALALDGNGISSGGALRNQSGTNTYGGAITIGVSGARINADAGTSLTLTGGVVTNIFRNVTFGGAGDTTVSTAAISGAGNLIKDGTGTVTLSGNNTYTGGTQISDGVLVLGNAAGFGSDGTISFGGGTLRYGSGVTTDLSSRYSTAASQAYRIDTNGENVTQATALGSSGGSLAKFGNGTLTLAAANTYTGTTTVNAGTLQIGAGGTDGSIGSTSGVSVASGATLAFNRSDSYGGSFTPAISGSGGLLLQSGSLTLATANTYTGNTTISAGVLMLGAANAIADSSSVVVNGGGLNLNGNNDTVAAVALTSGSIFGSGTLTAPTYGLGGGTVSASLGSGTITVTANSTLAATSAATAVNLNAGTLTLGSGGSRFTASGVAVTGSSGASLVLGGNETFGSLSGFANVALGGNNTLTVGSANANTTYSGTVSGVGGLTKSGNGTLTLAAANTYTGATTISSGTIIASVANAISGSSALTLGSDSSRGFLKVNDSLTISSLTFTGSGGDVVNGGSGTATFSATTGTATITVLGGSNAFHADATLASPTLVNVSNNAYFSFHNNISGSATFTKQGLGTLNIIGDNDGYSGSFLITGGRVNIGAGMNQIGTGTTTLSGGATLDLGGQAFTDRVVVLDGTILNAGGTATTTTIAGISTIGGTTAQGTYNITSTGSALFNVAVGDGAAAVNVSVNNGGGSGGRATFAQAIGTNGNVTVLGGGTATFDGTMAGYVISHGASTFNGNVLSGAEVQVNSGTAGTGSALFAADVASTVTVQSGAAAEFRGLVSGPTTISGSALFTSTSGLAGSSLTTNPGGVATLDNVTAAIAGSIVNKGSLIVNRTSGSQTISGLISGAGSVVKQGGGVLVLDGSNSYTGGTVITGGTVRAGTANALGASSGALALNAGALDLSGNTLTIGMLSGSAGTSISSNVAGAAKLLTNFTGDSTFGGVISDGGVGKTVGFTKAGTGKLTFTAAQTFTGDTIISGGTLALGSGASFADSAKIVVGDSTSSGAVLDLSARTSLTIGAGQTLQGKGTVLLGESTVLTVAGLLSPGNSPGLLTYDGGLTTLTGTTLMEIWGTSRGANPGYDAMDVINGATLTLGGLLKLDFNQNYAPDTSFLLVSATGGLLSGAYDTFLVTGTNSSYAGLEFTSQGGGVWQTNAAGDQVLKLTQTSSSLTLEVIVVAVPEPGTLVLAGIGAATAALALRRRRGRA